MEIWLRAVLTALVGVLVWQFVGLWVERKRSPPGPLPWPIVGNLFQLGTLPHQTFAKFAQRYGPLLFLKLGSRPLIVISSPHLAEEFLKNHDANWSARCPSVAGDIMFYGSRDMIYGPRWRLHRAIITQELLTNKRLTDFKKARQEEILKGINQALLESAGGKTLVQIVSIIRTMSLTVVMRMLMNEEQGDSVSEDFVETLTECVSCMGQAHLEDYFPLLAPFDIQGYKKQMRRVAQKMDGFFQDVLEDRRQKLQRKLDTSESKNIVDALLVSQVDGQGFEDYEMKAILQDFILAGTHTTAGSIEWALSELLKKPASMKNLVAEMDSVAGRERLVEESNFPNLPYLEAVVKEALRLHPIAPLMIPHASAESCEVEGYKFQAGTQLFVNVYAIQRDSNVWERASEFDPDRFLGNQKDVHGRDFDLLPFGSGRRICPGKNLGMVLFQYTLALMVQTCEFRLPMSVKPEELDMDERYELAVCRFNPLEVFVTPRLSNYVMESKSKL